MMMTAASPSALPDALLPSLNTVMLHRMHNAAWLTRLGIEVHPTGLALLRNLAVDHIAL